MVCFSSWVLSPPEFILCFYELTKHLTHNYILFSWIRLYCILLDTQSREKFSFLKYIHCVYAIFLFNHNSVNEQEPFIVAVGPFPFNCVFFFSLVHCFHWIFLGKQPANSTENYDNEWLDTATEMGIIYLCILCLEMQ